MTLRQLFWHILLFGLPGLTVWAIGPFPEHDDHLIRGGGCLVALWQNRPTTWNGVFWYAWIVSAPGPLLLLCADILGEVTAVRLHQLNKTPAGCWTALAYALPVMTSVFLVVSRFTMSG